MWRRLRCLVVVLAIWSLAVAPAWTQDAFYKGKTVRIVVGFAAGGGFDTYARAIARHIGKHIPGHPTIIVENMTGAGSLIAANYLYKIAKPDGLTMGHFIGGLFLGQVLERPGIEFEARKFAYIGVPVQDNPACVFSRASGITSLEHWMAARAPLKLGGTAPGSTTDDVPKLLKAALNLPIQLVAGYKGTAEIRLAIENGELAGACWGWDSIKATWRHGIESGAVVVVLQTLPHPHPDLPQVPLAITLASTEEARQLIRIGIHDASAITRPYVLPPGTPPERVQILRQAFQATLQDPEFLAEAEKARLDLNPLSGEALAAAVARLFTLEPAMVARLKDILK